MNSMLKMAQKNNLTKANEILVKAAHIEKKRESCQKLYNAEWREQIIKLETEKKFIQKDDCTAKNKSGTVQNKQFNYILEKPAKYNTSNISAGEINHSKAKGTEAADERNDEAHFVEDIPKDNPSPPLAENMEPVRSNPGQELLRTEIKDQIVSYIGLENSWSQ